MIAPGPAPLAVAAALVALAGCRGQPAADVCKNKDGALSRTAFVFVQTPRSGERVASGFRVTGCSSTFEGNVVWELRARDGRRLVRGFATGGGLETGPFGFTVAYAVATRQVGLLEVDEAIGSTTEGFPPVRNVVPLVLRP